MDFVAVRKKCQEWRHRHKMFSHDISRIENTIEQHIKNYSNNMVMYRQTHKNLYIENAEKEVEEITKLIKLVEQIELMSLLSRR